MSRASTALRSETRARNERAWATCAGLALVVAAGRALAACAHAPLEIARVDTDWIQPRVDEAAHAALHCIGAASRSNGRLIEIASDAEGKSRAFVHPYPASPAEQACADGEAARLRLPPSVAGVRSMIDGGGALVDQGAPRSRALSLRSRAVDQVAPVAACRAALLARAGDEARGAADDKQAAARARTGRISLALRVDGRGAIVAADVVTSTLDALATACTLAAARALRLPPIAGLYRYSYLYTEAGVLVGAPDVDPVDRFDFAVAQAAIAGRSDACFQRYRGRGRLLVHYHLGNDGVPTSVAVERDTASVSPDEDTAADRCVEREGAHLRVLPFDGPPALLTAPFSLR